MTTDTDAAPSGAGEGAPAPSPEAALSADMAGGEPAGGHEAAEAAEPTVADIAKSMGWKPKDEWKGDQSGWTDAASFIKKNAGTVKSLKAQTERTIRATEDLLNKQQAKLTKEWEAKLTEARSKGDTEGALEAQAEIHKVKETTTLASKQATFRASNPWFDANDDAKAIAIAAGKIGADKGEDIEQQFARAEKAVRKAMPELFEETDDADLDDAGSQSTPKTPKVAGGQRGGNPAPRTKGWADLPAAVRAQVTPKLLQSWKTTPAEYAASYYKENG